MRWGREEHESKHQHQHQQLHKKHTEKPHNQRLDKKIKEKQQNHRHQLQTQKHRETWLQPPMPLPLQSNYHHHHQQRQHQHHYHDNHQDKEDQTQQQPPHHHQNQQDNYKEARSSSSSSSSTPFSLFAPSSWISKLKHTLHPSKNTTTKSHQHPIPKPHHIHTHHLNSPDHPTIKPYKPDSATQPTSQHHHRTKLDKSATARTRPTTTTGSPPPPASKSNQVQPLSPTQAAARTSSVSDQYISFLPADLDDGVFLLPARRSYERSMPSGAAVYDANMDRRRRGLSFAFDPFGSSDAATAVPQLTRSESAKINRIASDLTTETTAGTSPQQRKKPARSRRDDFFSLFSAVPDTIRRINTTTTTTTTPSQSSSSVSTCTTTAAPRGSRLAHDSAHQPPEPRRRSFSGATGHKLRRKSKLRVHSPRVGPATPNKKLAQRKTQEAPPPAGKTPATAAAPHMRLESFAVVKCSSDPRRDFRDSMLEMITELDMARPDQLEGLLACYLSLNADEYHDVIVRVFRQVWLDLILDTASTTSPPNHHQRASA